MVATRNLVLWMLFSLSALISFSVQAELNVSVSRNPTNIEDTIQITIEATESVSGNPDLSPLKEDFELLGISQHSSFSFGSGAGRKQSIKRIVSAHPKAAGVLTIPPITWGKLRSKAVTLKVLDGANSTSQTGGQSEFYVEMDISNSSPYVQEQTVLTLKAYSKKNFSKGGFSNLTMPQGLVAKSVNSQSNVYETSVNGVAYIVHERRYLIQAERSGEYEINPIFFDAYFPGQQRNLWGQTQLVPKRARSEKLNITVKPIPDSVKGNWLPASQLTLSHFLSDGEHRVGEPITLTLSTIAEGLVEEQLSDINIALPSGLKSYADQPKIETSWNNGAVIAKRTDKIALIPTRGGDFKLPPIRLSWWNTKTDKAETAIIDNIHFTVTGSAAEPSNQAEPIAPIEPTSKPDEENNTKQNTPASQSPASTGVWPYLAALFAALWLMTLGILLYVLSKARKKPVAEKQTKSINTLNRTDLLKQLKSANAHDASIALVQWAQTDISSDICSIGQIRPYADNALKQAINDLSEHLYHSNQISSWSSAALIKAVKAFELEEKQMSTQNLRSLYPE